LAPKPKHGWISPAEGAAGPPAQDGWSASIQAAWSRTGGAGVDRGIGSKRATLGGAEPQSGSGQAANRV
jgi:hypothetical protein